MMMYMNKIHLTLCILVESYPKLGPTELVDHELGFSQPRKVQPAPEMT